MKKIFILLFLLSGCGHNNSCSQSTDRGPLASCEEAPPVAAPVAKPYPTPSPAPKLQPCGCPVGKPHKPGCRFH